LGTLSAPFEIVMGFEPTPVKPKSANFRKYFTGWWYERAAECVPEHVYGDCYLGIRETANFIRPAGDDWSFMEYIFSGRHDKTPAEEEQFCKDYCARHNLNANAWGYPWSWRMNLALKIARNNDTVIPYFNPTRLDPQQPEWDMYVDEWGGHPWRPSKFPSGDYLYTFHPYKEYQDAMLYYARECLRHGGAGIYYDNIWLIGTDDKIRNGDKWAGDGAQYAVHHIFDIRELMRRSAVLAWQERKLIEDRPLLFIHHTDCNIVPWLSFASSGYDWEMNATKGDCQDRFSDDYIMGQSLGTQCGVIEHHLFVGNHTDQTYRSFVAVCFAYDMLGSGGTSYPEPPLAHRRVFDVVHQFGYGDDSRTSIWPGYDPENPVKVLNAKDVRATTVKRKDGQTLLMIGNLGKQCRAEFDISGLKYQSCRIKNAETSKELSVGQKVAVDLLKHEYALLLVEEVK